MGKWGKKGGAGVLHYKILLCAYFPNGLNRQRMSGEEGGGKEEERLGFLIFDPSKGKENYLNSLCNLRHPPPLLLAFLPLSLLAPMGRKKEKKFPKERKNENVRMQERD